jgi:hypothetical protein
MRKFGNNLAAASQSKIYLEMVGYEKVLLLR